MLGEMCLLRRHLALEQTVEQVLAFGLDIVGATDEGSVDIGAVLAGTGECLFSQQSCDQRSYRARSPVIGGASGGDYLLWRQGTLTPQRFHHLAFGYGYIDSFLHSDTMIQMYLGVKIHLYFDAGLNQRGKRYPLRQ